MNRILIIIVITLSCYLGYNALMSNDGDNDNENVVKLENKAEKIVTNTDTSKIDKVEEHTNLATGVDISTIDYFGLYSQYRKTDDFEAELIVEILDETNYRHKRIITKDGQQQEAEVTGTYKIINDSVLQLFYPEERDIAIFTTPKALFTIEENGSLTSSDWVLTK